MMRLIKFLTFILIISSCQDDNHIQITEKDFRGKTFNINIDSQEDPFVIQFKDSTYQIFGQLWEGELPWRISHFEELNFLVLDNRVIGLNRKNENLINGEYIGQIESELKFTERKTKWNRNLINGEWINKKYDFNYSDSIPVPLPTSGVEEKFVWPPKYVITKDSIKLLHSYSVNKSNYEINNTAEFLITDLYNPENMRKEWQWEIKKLNDKNMIVQKRVADTGRTRIITDTLVKKR